MHAPIESKADLRRKFQKKKAMLPALTEDEARVRDPFSHKPIKARQDDPEYAGELANLDENIGRLLRGLETAGVAGNTVVIFTSDNGGRSALEWHGHPTSVQPLRGGKTFLFEGGIRVPLIIRWPGVTQPGSVCKTPVISMDFYPTLTNLAGVAVESKKLDGVSLIPLLKGQAIQRTDLFWHFPHYQGEGAYPASAIRSGSYKLIRHDHFDRDQLFDLARDPNEKNDLFEEEKDRAKAMGEKLKRRLDTMGAHRPVKNTRDDIVDTISERYKDRNPQ
ncbi:MAG: sulfatase/phosphatase domain-containing protein [Verrucomicrobiota bacterium]